MIEVGDLVRLKSAPLALGIVEGMTASGRAMVLWATTAQGIRMIRPVLLNELPEDLDKVPQGGMIKA